MSEEPAAVFESSNEFETQAVLDMLLQEGLHAVLLGNSNPNMLGFGNMGSMGTVSHLPQFRIFTPPEEAEKALELIGGFLGSLAMLEELTLEELEEAALEADGEREAEQP